MKQIQSKQISTTWGRCTDAFAAVRGLGGALLIVVADDDPALPRDAVGRDGARRTEAAEAAACVLRVDAVVVV